MAVDPLTIIAGSSTVLDGLSGAAALSAVMPYAILAVSLTALAFGGYVLLSDASRAAGMTVGQFVQSKIVSAASSMQVSAFNLAQKCAAALRIGADGSIYLQADSLDLARSVLSSNVSSVPLSYINGNLVITPHMDGYSFDNAISLTSWNTYIFRFYSPSSAIALLLPCVVGSDLWIYPVFYKDTLDTWLSNHNYGYTGYYISYRPYRNGVLNQSLSGSVRGITIDDDNYDDASFLVDGVLHLGTLHHTLRNLATSQFAHLSPDVIAQAFHGNVIDADTFVGDLSAIMRGIDDLGDGWAVLAPQGSIEVLDGGSLTPADYVDALINSLDYVISSDGALSEPVVWAGDNTRLRIDDLAVSATAASAATAAAAAEAVPAVVGVAAETVVDGYAVSGLKDVFPFCIPFDVYRFVSLLQAEREAPVISLPLKNATYGIDEQLEIDLSAFDSVAAVLRTLELLLFCVGLAMVTRSMIKW